MKKKETQQNVLAIYSTIAFLILFAVLSIAARMWSQGDNDLPLGDSAWTITLTQQMTALEKGATLSIPSPWDTRHVRLFAQSISHTGLKQKRSKQEQTNRDVVLVAHKAGSYIAEATFNVHVSSLARNEPKKLSISEDNRSRWLSSESHGIEINTTTAIKIVEQLSHAISTPDEMITKLFDYISNNTRIKKATNNNSETVLTKKLATELGANRALVALLRTAHLPARIVSGLDLQLTASQQPVFWTEVYDEERWLSLDPVNGYMRILPAYYVPLRRGSEELFETNNIKLESVIWKISLTEVPASMILSESREFSDVFDLNRLSPANRENLGILLLLPLGVLVTEILRQLLGVRTYGTFTPSLLALAIIHVDHLTAFIIFLFVTVIGISIRSLLPALNLKRTPLLGIVFTLVALSMTFIVSAFMYYDPTMDSVVVLLPVVILTMLVDRIYSITDQRGLRTAMIRLVWTVVAALLSLSVLLQVDWGYLLVTYPELHAITLAAIILIGQCSCYKLKGLKSLNWMYEPDLRRGRQTDKNTDKNADKKSGDISHSEQSGDNL